MEETTQPRLRRGFHTSLLSFQKPSLFYHILLLKWYAHHNLPHDAITQVFNPRRHLLLLLLIYHRHSYAPSAISTGWFIFPSFVIKFPAVYCRLISPCTLPTTQGITAQGPPFSTPSPLGKGRGSCMWAGIISSKTKRYSREYVRSLIFPSIYVVVVMSLR